MASVVSREAIKSVAIFSLVANTIKDSKRSLIKDSILTLWCYLQVGLGNLFKKKLIDT